jgi:hypothetical protein
MINKLLLIASLFLISSLGETYEDNWIVIAKKDVSYKADKDEITLIGNERKIDKVKISCTQGSLKLKSITVYYTDNSSKTQKAKGTGLISKGMSSIAFSLEKNKTPKKLDLTMRLSATCFLQKELK